VPIIAPPPQISPCSPARPSSRTRIENHQWLSHAPIELENVPAPQRVQIEVDAAKESASDLAQIISDNPFLSNASASTQRVLHLTFDGQLYHRLACTRDNSGFPAPPIVSRPTLPALFRAGNGTVHVSSDFTAAWNKVQVPPTEDPSSSLNQPPDPPTLCSPLLKHYFMLFMLISCCSTRLPIAPK
jgi:hypothetical protein